MKPNQIIETLLLKKDFAWPNRGVKWWGNDIQEISKAICAGNVPSDALLFTTGVWLHPNGGIPVRLPALIVPALRVMEGFVRIWLPPPKYLVYQATWFIVETNGIRPEIAKRTSESMRKYLEAYVSEFHPGIRDFVEFEFQGLESSSVIRESIRRVSSVLALPEYHDDMEELRQYRIHSNRPEWSEYPYGAANALYNCADDLHYPFASIIEKHGTRCVLPIGWAKERPFFEITKILKNRTGWLLNIPLLQATGEMPAYYPNERWDVTDVREIIKEGFYESEKFNGLHGGIRHDLRTLWQDTKDLWLLANSYTGSVS